MADNERQMTRMNVTITNHDGSKSIATVWDLGQAGQTYVDVHGNTIALDPGSLAAAAHREGAKTVHNYIDWLAANDWNVSGKTFPSKYWAPAAQRLQDAQGLPYQPLYVR